MKIITKEVAGSKQAITVAMRNPFNSWAMADSYTDSAGNLVLGPKDKELALKLAHSGSDHRTYLRQIVVWADVTAPLYWWKEMDRYRMGVEKLSCSTMHTIHRKAFDPEDFECESIPSEHLHTIINRLNSLRGAYLYSKNKQIWRAMIQLLPESYLQTRSLMMSYEALRVIYKARKGHKLQEWQQFREWIETLPNHELITG